MARWGEIKCPRCAELEAKLIETAKGLAGEIRRADTAEAKLAEQDALWEGMERALEESDAREARLEAKLAKVISLADAMAEAIEDQISLCDASMDEQIAVKNYRTTLAELTGGQKDE